MLVPLRMYFCHVYFYFFNFIVALCFVLDLGLTFLGHGGVLWRVVEHRVWLIDSSQDVHGFVVVSSWAIAFYTQVYHLTSSLVSYEGQVEELLDNHLQQRSSTLLTLGFQEQGKRPTLQSTESLLFKLKFLLPVWRSSGWCFVFVQWSGSVFLCQNAIRLHWCILCGLAFVWPFILLFHFFFFFF